MKGICVHRPKISERVRLSSVVCGTACSYAWLRGVQANDAARSPERASDRAFVRQYGHFRPSRLRDLYCS
jgi:hypothetical protein